MVEVHTQKINTDSIQPNLSLILLTSGLSTEGPPPPAPTPILFIFKRPPVQNLVY